jgi:Protein of unknown function (DUF3619)
MTANPTPNKTAIRTVTQDQFAQRIRCAMNESADLLPAGMDEKLRAARRQALNVRKQTHSSGFMGFVDQCAGVFSGMGGRLAFAAPALVLGVGLYAMSQTNADSYVQSVAEIDTQVLSQELPIDALLDKGFVRFVQVGE